MDRRRELGIQGETAALSYLDKKGYEILARNYRCRFGEIDIVAKKRNVLSFIEVKTRSSEKYGTPGEAVNERKMQHIEKTAHCFLEEKKPTCESLRIDVVEVLYKEERFFVRHLKGVTG